MSFNNYAAKTKGLRPIRDSGWLTLEVCREFERKKCPRPDDDCKYAHPPINIEIQNGRVKSCYDSIKGRCQRYDPPCRYFHPPQHLKDQLLQNGRNNLTLKNSQLQGLTTTMPQFVPSIFPVATQPPGFIIQPSNCLTNYINTPMQSTAVDTQSSNGLNYSMSTAAVMENTAQQLPVQDYAESEYAVNGWQPSFLMSSGSQNVYWMNSCLSSMAYYSPVFYQGMNTPSGVIPVVKTQLMPDMRNGGVPVYQCAAPPPYTQVVLAPSMSTSLQQTSYPLAASTIYRY